MKCACGNKLRTGREYNARKCNECQKISSDLDTEYQNSDCDLCRIPRQFGKVEFCTCFVRSEKKQNGKKLFKQTVT